MTLKKAATRGDPQLCSLTGALEYSGTCENGGWYLIDRDLLAGPGTFLGLRDLIGTLHRFFVVSRYQILITVSAR